MPVLQNLKYAGRKLLLGSFGEVEFDENGLATVSDEAVLNFMSISGFSLFPAPAPDKPVISEPESTDPEPESFSPEPIKRSPRSRSK
jgi:hypothetical protein